MEDGFNLTSLSHSNFIVVHIVNYYSKNENLHPARNLNSSVILCCRFTLPPFLTLKNFEGLNLGKMDEVNG